MNRGALLPKVISSRQSYNGSKYIGKTVVLDGALSFEALYIYFLIHPTLDGRNRTLYIGQLCTLLKNVNTVYN